MSEPERRLSLRFGLPLPNLLATRAGRLTAFFLLYVTEGIPLGFTATAVATQMRRQGLGPAQIGVFVGTLYLPWALKFLVGPVVDVVYSQRLGRRRGWIVAMQSLMAVALLISMGVDFTAELQVFTAIIFVMNMFGATQDVAIDALACSTLSEAERGTANGLMFAGAYMGSALGGSGVLYLSEVIGFSAAGLLAVGAVLVVTVFVALPLREPREERDPSDFEGARLAAIGGRVRGYLLEAIRAMFLTRSALMAAVFAILPCGALSLSLALGSNLAVELGLSDSDIATLGLISTVVSAAGCVLGGFLSDRLGRRKMLAIYVACMAGPALVMAYYMQRYGYVMPVDPTMENRPAVAPTLVTVFWAVSIAYAVFQGLMYGTRTALFMDVCDPAVAATQFTAYMSMLNFVIWYSATWQGWAIERWGYPLTLTVDVSLGAVCLLALPWVKPRKVHAHVEDVPAEPGPPPAV